MGLWWKIIRIIRRAHVFSYCRRTAGEGQSTLSGGSQEDVGAPLCLSRRIGQILMRGPVISPGGEHEEKATHEAGT